MDVKTTLAPGQNGTKRLYKTYGDQLVCVRYRDEKAHCKRLKTIELIIDELDWSPGVTIPRDSRVAIQIDYGEIELRDLVKGAGGFWSLKK